MNYLKFIIIKFVILEPRDIIWNELYQCRFKECYLEAYIEYHQKFRKLFEFSTLLFSAGGLLGLKFWEHSPTLACCLITIFKIIEIVNKKIIRSESEIKSISQLKADYIDAGNKLETIFINNEFDLNSKSVKIIFSNLVEISKRDDLLDIPQRDNLKKSARLRVKAFLKKYNIN